MPYTITKLTKVEVSTVRLNFSSAPAIKRIRRQTWCWYCDGPLVDPALLFAKGGNKIVCGECGRYIGGLPGVELYEGK